MKTSWAIAAMLISLATPVFAEGPAASAAAEHGAAGAGGSTGSIEDKPAAPHYAASSSEPQKQQSVEKNPSARAAANSGAQ